MPFTDPLQVDEEGAVLAEEEIPRLAVPVDQRHRVVLHEAVQAICQSSYAGP